jgi:hypothetical protein
MPYSSYCQTNDYADPSTNGDPSAPAIFDDNTALTVFIELGRLM